MGEREISIWFFVGIALLVCGGLTFGAGLYQIFHPPANPVTLFQLHANAWWGGVLFILGVFYCVRFAPRAPR